MSKLEIVKIFVQYLSLLWKIHPFREGNTRSVSVLMFLLAKNNNMNLDVDFISKHAKYFRNAMVLNSIGKYSEPEHLESFLIDAFNFCTVDYSDKKYTKIKDYEVDNYQYKQHIPKQ